MLSELLVPNHRKRRSVRQPLSTPVYIKTLPDVRCLFPITYRLFWRNGYHKRFLCLNAYMPTKTLYPNVFYRMIQMEPYCMSFWQQLSQSLIRGQVHNHLYSCFGFWAHMVFHGLQSSLDSHPSIYVPTPTMVA